MKKTKNQKLMEEIYSKVARPDEIYHPREMKKAILLAIQITQRAILTRGKDGH